jgi:hypothetical protein
MAGKDAKKVTISGPGLHPTAIVRTGVPGNYGHAILGKGEALPADIADGEFERLDALGVFDEPAAPVVDDRAVAERAASAPGGVLVGEDPDDVEDAAELAPVPSTGDGLEHV